MPWEVLCERQAEKIPGEQVAPAGKRSEMLQGNESDMP